MTNVDAWKCGTCGTIVAAGNLHSCDKDKHNLGERHAFFVKRLKEIGMYDEDSDYGGLVGKWIEELSIVFVRQGHSGSSAIITVDLFKELLDDWMRGKHRRRRDENS